MDVDLSSDLKGLLPLLAPLLSGHGDLAIGSRLARGALSPVAPSALISHTRIAGCFTCCCAPASATPSAVSKQFALTPFAEVRDEAWFFDTELLVLAQRQGAADSRGTGRLGR